MENLSFQNGEMRRFERKQFTKTIAYSVNLNSLNSQKKLNLNGKLINISDAGIGIETDYSLSPGHTLWFNSDIKHETGAVRWCMKFDDSYRVGVELAEEPQSVFHDEELQEDVSIVHEGKEKYTKFLDVATDKFNAELENIEKSCYDPEAKQEELSKAIEKAMDEVLCTCEEFELRVKDSDIIHDARIEFHKKTNPILSKSYCINRARTWPQGYQGDYKTLETAYRNTPLSEGIGYFLDVFILNLPLAEAVRNRIKKLEGMLGAELLAMQQPSVLNIACGSCRELLGIVPEISDSGAKVTCIDSDNDALTYAQSRLSKVGIESQIEFYKYNALRMFDDELNMMEFGKQDIIYSLGLFDYLPDDFLIKMLGALYRLLNPGGKLIAAFKDADSYRPQEYHWITDWDGFLQRKEDDFNRLFNQAGIPQTSLSVSREETGVIIFYVATK
jgi:SAM-dependent methyltransferase